MPTAVFVLGVLSIAMLIWTDRISHRQRIHFAFANAVMDFRISAATSHLWLEEAISGKSVVEMERSLSDLREANRLSDVLLNGGESEYGLIVEPLKDPDLRRRAEDLRRLLSQWEITFHERIQRPETAGEGSVLENRNDEIFDELQRSAAELERIVEGNQASDYAKSRRLFFGILLSWSSIVVVSTAELVRRERRRREAEEALRRAHHDLEVRVQERTADLARMVETLLGQFSERKHAEEALQSLFEAVPVGLFRSTPAGQILAANPALVQILGYPEAQTLMQASSADLYAELADRQLWQLQVEREGFIRDAEIRARRWDGTFIWVRMSVHATRDAQGSVSYYEGVVEDITQPRLAREMRNRLAAIVESSHDAIISKTLDGIILTWNRGAERIFGYTAAEVVGNSMSLLIPPDLADELPGVLGDLRSGQRIEDFETMYVRRDGQGIHVSLTMSPILDATGRIVGDSTIARDITERKQAEAALRESEARLSAIISSAMDAIIATDAKQRIILFNPAAEETFRCSASDVLGQPLDRLIPVRFRDVHQEHIRTFERGSLDKIRMGDRRSVFGLRLNGEEFPADAAVSRIDMGHQKLYMAVVRDITERKRSEEALRKLSSAVEQTAESVCITDQNGFIEYVNPAFERLNGYTLEEARGNTPRILKSGEHDPALYEKLWNTILGGQVFRGVLINNRKDGTLYQSELVISPIRDAKEQITHFVCTGRDITQRIRTEQALRRLNERLEREPKRIAQALHDEAGQFLSSAHIALAEIARDLPLSVRERLQQVRGHLDRVEEQLRRLAHELRPRILDDLGLVSALNFLAEGVEKRRGISITVDASLEGRLPSAVETTLYRLAQEALTNVAKHARATRVTIQLKQEPRWIRCAIRDDGVGFDVPAALSRAGERGLGLVGIQDRVEALVGTLQITSAPDRGTELVAVVPLEV